MEKQKTTADTPDVYLCPHCGRGVWMSGERPYHMAYCKWVAGCGWYGLLENCTVFNPLKDTDVD